MKIFRERAGVISREPVWVMFTTCHMYTGNTLIGLLWQACTEWKHDRHLIG